MTRAPFDPRDILPPTSEVLPNLWIGGRPSTYIGYELAVSCEQHLARRPMDDYEGLVLHCPMQDEDDFHIDPVRIGHAASLVTVVLQREGKVLIHCTGGLNRSAVVAARAIEIFVGCTPREAVALLRKQRDEYVLCNRAFERWVLGEALPTAETSAFLSADAALCQTHGEYYSGYPECPICKSYNE